MKKTSILIAMACLIMAGCGVPAGVSSGSTSTTTSSSSGNILNDIFGVVANGETIGNVISSVIGLDKVSQKQLIGTWRYDGPGCAFTSDNALAKAGGEVAATQVEEKLKTQYDKLGLTDSNTQFVFNEDGTFSAKVAGKSFSGKYTYNESSCQLQLKGLLLSITGYTKRSGSGISILFESKKLLSLLQTLAALSGNTTLQTIGEISKSYDGIRVGFDMKK